MRDKSGNHIPVAVKEGETVLLPDYGGTQVKLEDKEYAPSLSLLSIYTHFYISVGNYNVHIRPCLVGKSNERAMQQSMISSIRSTFPCIVGRVERRKGFRLRFGV